MKLEFAQAADVVSLYLKQIIISDLRSVRNVECHMPCQNEAQLAILRYYAQRADFQFL
ncbi:unnamed protein product [marine sediment metagenome]|uniref:Uncharacterized protein n=1 Tax=marine sediment metagenome TaxID=412755 RepID=X1K664_9ZZZZ